MSTQIQDGTVKWETKDIRVKAIVDLMYPVGTVIAVANDNTPAFTKYGAWEKVGSGRVLWGADHSHKTGTTIEPGLPNITGELTNEFRGRPINDTGAISFTATGGAGGVGGGVTLSERFHLMPQKVIAYMVNLRPYSPRLM